MSQKLLAFVNKKIQPDNLDTPAAQEILLPGHIYLNIFQQKLRDLVNFSARNLMRQINNTFKPQAYSDRMFYTDDLKLTFLQNYSRKLCK